ncbi:MAG TPA: hypothetical protein P5105_00070 [Victivallales bacterium]|nr:hypothetical protein [Victivallales bacterium]HRR28502.1 hypothetical protein [Victivallales bacterium]
MVPKDSDFAFELNGKAFLKVKKLVEIAEKNPAYLSFKTVFEANGLNFEKSINKILIAGQYRKKVTVIFDTNLSEREFISIINTKKPETFNISGKKIYKYSENNKIIFTSILKNGKIIFSENPSIVTDFQPIDFERVIKASYPISNNYIVRGYFRNFEDVFNSKKNEKDKRSIFGNGIKEGYFEFFSKDGNILENVLYFIAEPENQKLVEFQTNALLMLVTAKIASGNQVIANQIRDSFKISTQGNLIKVYFKLDSSFLDTKVSQGDNFDPFE